MIVICHSIRSHGSGYFWIRDLPFRIRFPCALIRRIRQWIRIFSNPHSRVVKKIRNKSDNAWTGESGYFQIRSRCKVVSSLLPNNKPIWRTRCRSNFFMAHALKTFYCRGALGTLVNLDTVGCMWIGEFDLNTLRVNGESFESGKKKLRIQKYPDTCGRGLSFLSNHSNARKGEQICKVRTWTHCTNHWLSL